MPTSNISIFVLIDALGWQYLEGREFLSDLLPYRTPLRTVLGFSSGAIPTILTGQYPSKTGHWNLCYYDPQGSPFRWLRYFGFLPDYMLNHRITGKLLKELGRHFLGMGPSFECVVSPRLLPWFNWVEKRNIYDYNGIRGAASIFDLLKKQHVPHRIYSYHRWCDKEIFQQVRRDLQANAAKFYFLYLCELDMFLHSYCSMPQKIDERLSGYERELRTLFRLARQQDSATTMTIFSDHGMAPVRQHYDLISEIEALSLSMPEDYLAVYDSTMARYWFFSDKARVTIIGHLRGCSCGRILSDEELQDLGVFFADRRYGEVVFLLQPGCLLAKSNFNGPQWIPAGMHGYHPADPYSDAIFLSNRQPNAPLITIADVYTCMQQTASA